MTKTHGTCRRHFVAALQRYEIPLSEIDRVLATMNPADFCPDLQK
jgi:hypothetical protein